MQKLWFLIFVLLCCQCKVASWMKVSSEQIKTDGYQVPEGLPSVNSWKSYIVDSLHLDHLPVKRLRLNFHFMNSADGSQNFSDLKRAQSFAYSMETGGNKKIEGNKKALLPLHNDIPVLQPRYKYKKFDSPGTEANKGTYIHYDDELYYYVKEGKNKNIGDRAVFEKYGIGMDSIVNVFLMPHHPDSLLSETYSGGRTGVAIGHHTKITTTSINKLDAWKNTSNFNHEVGHILGLPHSWGNDGCEDTPRHNNRCWNFTTDGSVCDSMVSNNMMSYNIMQNSISPCQIGKMQRNMANEKSKIRKYIIKDWCNFQPDKPIVIKEKIFWTGDKDLLSDIEILPGAELYISSRISMAPKSKILVHKNATLILDGARLHNDCSKQWKGIFTHEKIGGEIIYLNNPVIEDVEEITKS